MRYVEIYGFNGRENGGIARLTVVRFRSRKKWLQVFLSTGICRFPQAGIARQMITAKIFDKPGICRFPQAGAPRQEYGFAVLTNQGRIHERLQKNDGCKTAFVIFGMPDKNKTNRGLTGIEPITNP